MTDKKIENIIEEEEKEELKNLEEKLEAEKAKFLNLQKELDLEKEKFLRIIADYDNKMKRSQIDSQNYANSIISKLVKDFTAIADDLKNAHEIANDELKKGINLITENFNKILKKYGVEKITPKTGEKFDHNKHQAIITKESDDYESGSILEILKDGYSYQNQTIVPAIVIITQ